jgi:hypothetical protein
LTARSTINRVNTQQVRLFGLIIAACKFHIFFCYLYLIVLSDSIQTRSHFILDQSQESAPPD